MNSPEDLFRVAKLAPPSADLDRRMRAMFGEARSQPTRRHGLVWRWSVWLAAAGVAAAAGAAIAIGLGHRPGVARVAPATYEVQPQPVVRAWLLGSPGDRRPPGRMAVKVTTS